MNDSKISVRYARALFNSAVENKVPDKVRKDMDLVQKVCGISEFQYLLQSPVMKESVKINIVKGILEKDIDPLSLGLLELVFKNGREMYIPSIVRNYKDLYKKMKGIKSALLVTPEKLSKEQEQEILDKISKSLKTQVELETKEDEALIGGFLIRIDDQQYDASVSNSLKKIQKQLLN